jgi:hypothetical protein
MCASDSPGEPKRLVVSVSFELPGRDSNPLLGRTVSDDPTQGFTGVPNEAGNGAKLWPFEHFPDSPARGSDVQLPVERRHSGQGRAPPA